MGLVYKRGFLHQGSRRRNPRKIVLSVLAVAVVIGAVLAFLGKGPSKAAPPESPETQAAGVQVVKPVQAQASPDDPFKDASRVTLNVARAIPLPESSRKTAYPSGRPSTSLNG
jgi:hypothetical protein